MTQAQTRAARRRVRRVDTIVLCVAVVLVLVAVGCGVTAYLVHTDASDTRNRTVPLEARARTLRAEVASVDVANAKLGGLFGAIRAEAKASSATVALTNQAAASYNNGASGIADALGAQATAAVDAQAAATRDVRSNVAAATAALSALSRSGG